MNLTSLLLLALLAAQAPQAPNPTQQPVANQQGASSVPIYRVNVVARTIKAINYRHRSGATKIDFRGTALMPDARGEAKVESKKGYIEIEVEFDKLQPATKYGAEYLTFVLWAITPEGRTTNLGEVLLNGTDAKMNVTTELQSFGLLVTAEPYFAVTQPSDVVVMENIVRGDTQGRIEEVDAKFELLQRGQYVLYVNPADIKPMVLDKRVPLELYEARNAVQIARWTGADRYASDTFRKAADGLQTAEGYLIRKAGKKSIATVAREAAQTAEDARIITVKRMEEERLANERAAAAEREARANAEADLKTRQAAQAEADRAAAERLRMEAQVAADLASKQKLEAQVAAEMAGRQKAEAEAARAAALAQQQIAESEADKARLAAQEADRLRQNAEQEKEQLRSRLMQQLNLILETRDTARGLIVNMSDVLFDTGKYTLRPGAREKLAKIAGIVLSHPGLALDVEGHTDSVGDDDYNQRLSENRAAAVRDFLIQQGISAGSISARGFGETMPVTSNDNAAGRQRNRRVEMVVSGEAIGVPPEYLPRTNQR